MKDSESQRLEFRRFFALHPTTWLGVSPHPEPSQAPPPRATSTAPYSVGPGRRARPAAFLPPLASGLRRTPPPGQARVLTRRESRDPRNLASDLRSENREILLVAFEVRRHGSSGVMQPRPGEGTAAWGPRRARFRSEKRIGDSSQPSRFLVVLLNLLSSGNWAACAFYFPLRLQD